jgi:hypothetical protein
MRAENEEMEYRRTVSVAKRQSFLQDQGVNNPIRWTSRKIGQQDNKTIVILNSVLTHLLAVHH